MRGLAAIMIKIYDRGLAAPAGPRISESNSSENRTKHSTNPTAEGDSNPKTVEGGHPTDGREPQELQDIDFAAERAAAERLLKLKKGIVSLGNGKTTWEMTEPLPFEPFFISSVQMAISDVTDEEVAMLAGCRGLIELRLHNNPKLTAAGLKTLGPLPRLESLNLAETACARESLEFISNYPRLTSLFLAGGGSQKVLSTLPPCPRLTILETPWADGTVGDQGLQTIARNCPQLTQLTLLDGSDYSLAPLAQLQKLRQLHCSGKQLNDAAIAALAALPDFDSLGIEVPDRAVMQRLGKLDQKLRELSMRNQLGLSPELLADAADWQVITRCTQLERLTILSLIAVDATALAGRGRAAATQSVLCLRRPLAGGA
jgi:hypothetical protein